jgi:hypothetical protein
MDIRDFTLMMASVRDRAVERNTQSASSARRELTQMLREETLKEPMRGFDDCLIKARSDLDRVKKRAESATAILANISTRSGLEGKAFEAEAIAPRMVLAMHKSLEQMYEAAKSADSAYPLKCIAIAAEILVSNIDDNLLRETRYPKTDMLLRHHMADSKIGRSLALHRSLVEALDGTDAELKVEFPPPPW